MSSVSQKIKKQKKKIQAFIAMRGHRRWQKHPNALKRLDTFFDSVCTPGFYGMYQAYKAPDPKLDLSLMPAFEENLTTGRNRWKHLGCLEATRVKLTLGPVDYIHANYISSPEHPKRMITTQAPLDKTVADFWYMVLQEESEIIISLCPVDEKPYALCDKRADTICSNYFNKKAGSFYYFNDAHLTVVTCQVYVLEYEQNGVKAKIFMREIEIIVKDERKFNCRHYHWIWDQNLTEKMTSIPMQFLQNLPKTDKPIVIHCRDGVRLTGCFVMFQYYLDLLKADNCEREILSPASYLAELRQQRHHIIKSVYQFLYIHLVLLKYFAEESGKDHPQLGKFAKEYSEFMQTVNLESF